ncbi:MAG: hypothetical protein ACOX1L_00535 [Erysipelotrichaceae bacterium]|jgi:hypothetical protein
MQIKTKKLLIAIVTLLILITGTIGATLAWLTDQTDTVKNTFTVGNVDITLTETTGDEYKMVPGNPINKDPKVTVLQNSEECWLFIEIIESDNLADFIDYSLADGWSVLGGGVNNVYYRLVAASDIDQEFEVIAGNAVNVKSTVTKDMMDDLEDDPTLLPTLTFKAYAVQKAGVDSAAEAWAIINTP